MPGTYSQILLHVVFSTKGRTPWITPEVAERLYPYIGGIITVEKGVLHEIGGRGGSRALIFALADRRLSRRPHADRQGGIVAVDS